MRLNLGCGEDVRPVGYINVDRFPQGQIPPEVYRQGDFTSLDWIAEDGTVEEIVALDCLEYLPTSQVKNTLANWVDKLSSGGTLKILVPDCFAIARAFAQGQFNLEDYLKMTFGTQIENDSRLSAIDTITLCAILEGMGLTITSKRFEGVAVYLEATK